MRLGHTRDFPVAQMVNNLPAMQETCVQSLGQEDSLEREMATHSSVLAWRIPWTEEPGGIQSMGLQRVGHDWATNTHTLCSQRAFLHKNSLRIFDTSRNSEKIERKHTLWPFPWKTLHSKGFFFGGGYLYFCFYFLLWIDFRFIEELQTWYRLPHNLHLASPDVT